MATDMKAATALTLLIPDSISHSAELMTFASQYSIRRSDISVAVGLGSKVVC